jgi:hypothetical protein
MPRCVLPGRTMRTHRSRPRCSTLLQNLTVQAQRPDRPRRPGLPDLPRQGVHRHQPRTPWARPNPGRRPYQRHPRRAHARPAGPLRLPTPGHIGDSLVARGVKLPRQPHRRSRRLHGHTMFSTSWPPSPHLKSIPGAAAARTRPSPPPAPSGPVIPMISRSRARYFEERSAVDHVISRLTPRSGTAFPACESGPLASGGCLGGQDY